MSDPYEREAAKAAIQTLEREIARVTEQYWIESGNSRKLIELTRQLETELDDMREMFREYVKVDNLWDILLTEGADAYEEALAKYHKLRKQAKEVLGL